MKWRDRRRSSNIEDRRGQSTGGGFSRRGGGPRLRIPSGRSMGRGGAGSLGLIVVVVVIALALGVDPMQLLSGGTAPQTQTQTSGSSRTGAGEDDMSQFVAVVLAETEDLWTEVFEQNGLEYVFPNVVLYSGRTDASGCGLANAGTGPFYCPADQKIYIDLSFYDVLRRQFGATGDFAQAYVLAHEVGHHVQQLTGVLPDFNAQRGQMSEQDANAMSVRVELQADCYAGIWANYAGQENLLERGDIEEALNAATQIGDDAIQERTQGVAVPRTFTHGTSAQRKRWFETGYESGDVGACDTFGGAI